MTSTYRPPAAAQGRINRFLELHDDGIITLDERDAFLTIAYAHVVVKLTEQGRHMMNTSLDAWILDLERDHYRARVIDAGRRFALGQPSITATRPEQLSLFA